MSMRITEGMTSTRLLNDLRRAENAANQSSAQISSGRRLLDAAIDPLATHRALRLRHELTQFESLQETVAQAKGWMQNTDEALTTINDAVHRARELTIKAGSGAMQQSDRLALAEEISNLIGAVKLAANARFNDSYIFGGQVTDGAPYDPAGADAYAGDTGGIVRTIGPGVSMQINVTGGSILGDGTDGRLLNTLRDIQGHLTGGTAADIAALQTTALTGLDSNLADVLSARSLVGTGVNRLDHADGRLSTQVVTATDFLNRAESTDMAETIIKLNSQQSIYQAAISSGASIIKPSLMDFLR
jgi:flagellar hook-associated protein 3 FlgL